MRWHPIITEHPSWSSSVPWQHGHLQRVRGWTHRGGSPAQTPWALLPEEALSWIPSGDGEAAGTTGASGWNGRPGRRHICWAGGPGIWDIVFLAESGGCQKPDKLITSDMGQSSFWRAQAGPPETLLLQHESSSSSEAAPESSGFWEGAAAAGEGLDRCGSLGWQHSSSSCLRLAVLPPDLTCFAAGPGWVAAGSWGMGMYLGFVQLLSQQGPRSGAVGVPMDTQSPGRLHGTGMCGLEMCRAWQGCSCWRSQAASCGPSAQPLQAGVLCWELGAGCPSVCCWTSGVMLVQPRVGPEFLLSPSEQHHGLFMVGFPLWGSDQSSLVAGCSNPRQGRLSLHLTRLLCPWGGDRGATGPCWYRVSIPVGWQLLTLHSPHCSQHSLERRRGRALFSLCWGFCTAVEQREFSCF